MTIDIETLGLRELDALLAAAERRKALLANRRSAAVVRRALTAFAASHGYAIEEVLGARSAPSTPKERPRTRKKSKVAIKYRDPDNKRNTWSGRGRMPRWLADKTRRGQNAAYFLIPGLGQPTAKTTSSIGRKSVVKKGHGPER